MHALGSARFFAFHLLDVVQISNVSHNKLMDSLYLMPKRIFSLQTALSIEEASFYSDISVIVRESYASP
jgi:hypothetical protein